MNTKIEQILKEITTTSPFHGAVASSVDFKESSKIDFLASNIQSDKMTIYFNPVEILNHTDEYLAERFQYEINHLISRRR